MVDRYYAICAIALQNFSEEVVKLHPSLPLPNFMSFSLFDIMSNEDVSLGIMLFTIGDGQGMSSLFSIGIKDWKIITLDFFFMFVEV
jgi:hypothetical protein